MTLSNLIKQINELNSLSTVKILKINSKDYKINDLKGMDFFLFLNLIKTITPNEQQMQLLNLYFMLNDKPVIFKEHNYDTFKEHFINRLYKYKQKQLFIVIKSKSKVRKVVPLFLTSPTSNFQATVVFKQLLKDINELDRYSIIINDKSIHSSEKSGKLMYYPLFLSLQNYNSEFSITMDDFIIVNQNSFIDFKN